MWWIRAGISGQASRCRECSRSGCELDFDVKRVMRRAFGSGSLFPILGIRPLVLDLAGLARYAVEAVPVVPDGDYGAHDDPPREPYGG